METGNWITRSLRRFSSATEQGRYSIFLTKLQNSFSQTRRGCQAGGILNDGGRVGQEESQGESWMGEKASEAEDKDTMQVAQCYSMSNE